ncbi:MAG: hypothetical protein CMH54_05185 [Myxococcales bacterium]|nr:hypothetical protein [Myxococcales bacterium]
MKRLSIIISTLCFVLISPMVASASHPKADRRARVLRATSQVNTSLEQAQKTLRKQKKAVKLSVLRNLRLMSLWTAELEEEARLKTSNRRIRHAFTRLDAQFNKTRRLVHRSLSRPSDAVLDAWYEVAFSMRNLRKKVKNLPTIRPQQNLTTMLRFQGEIDGVEIDFIGRNHDAIYRQCKRFLSDTPIRVRGLKLNGKSFRPNRSKTTPVQACALIALNARMSRGKPALKVTGSIGRAPISIQANSYAELKSTVSSLVPLVVSPRGVRRLNINGKRVTRRGRAWSGRAAAHLILNSVRRKGDVKIASGKMDRTPFVFTSKTRAGIRTECLDFHNAVLFDQTVHTIRVNGQKRRIRGWTPNQLCSFVSQLAKDA